MFSPILHLTHWAEWEEALQRGSYTAPSLDGVGFIHCSFPHQLERVANAFYANHANLVILVIDASRLTSPLKVEKAVDVEDEYPHIYGPLNLDAVTEVVPLLPASDQLFHLPQGLA